jgi:hypothetical protein
MKMKSVPAGKILHDRALQTVPNLSVLIFLSQLPSKDLYLRKNGKNKINEATTSDTAISGGKLI